MLTSVLIKLGLAVFSALPIERIIAALLNKWIGKIDTGNIDKARKTAEHLAELSALFNDILSDKQVSPDELGKVRESVIRARERLLAAWAVGADAKATQVELGKAGLVAGYVEPLLKGAGCVLLCALMLGASGCVTRTRCQALTFDGCTFNVNEPVGSDDPKYPRSLQIGVNDQQIEGGTDTIASGNKTDPSVTVPMGDSALGALGTFFSGLIKGGGTSSTKASTAAPVTAAAGGAACSDGSCNVQ
jgi:hypothetical protein